MITGDSIRQGLSDDAQFIKPATKACTSLSPSNSIGHLARFDMWQMTHFCHVLNGEPPSLGLKMGYYSIPWECSNPVFESCSHQLLLHHKTRHSPLCAPRWSKDNRDNHQGKSHQEEYPEIMIQPWKDCNVVSMPCGSREMRKESIFRCVVQLRRQYGKAVWPLETGYIIFCTRLQYFEPRQDNSAKEHRPCGKEHCYILTNVPPVVIIKA